MDHSGFIDISEFAPLMEAIGLELTEPQIVCVFNDTDLNNDDTVDFDEYLKMVTADMKPSFLVAGAADDLVNGEYKKVLGGFKKGDVTISKGPMGAKDHRYCLLATSVWWIEYDGNGRYYSCDGADRDYPPATGWTARQQESWTWSNSFGSGALPSFIYPSGSPANSGPPEPPKVEQTEQQTLATDSLEA